MDRSAQKSATGRQLSALVLTIAGAYVWFFNNSDNALALNLMSGVGVLIFLIGVTHLGLLKSWAGLSKKERKTKLMVMGIVGAILLFGMFIFF